ncbi:MAG: DUF2851 family protein [Verrucomicrobiales bacterium]
MNPDPTDLPGAARYARFRADVFRSDSAAEPVRRRRSAVARDREDELAIQAQWFAGAFGRDFLTADGKPVRVVQFGCWNRAAGPDFTECAVEIEGERLGGAIELDLDARGWEQHGHAANPAYDNVVLHLFASPPADGARFFTRTSQNREVPQVVLDLECLDGAPAPLGQAEAKLGRCATPLREMPAARVADLLEAAAQYRLGVKGGRLRRIAEIHGRGQAVYAGVAEALGYRHNKLPMAVLAGRLPVGWLRNHPAEEAEAMLFGAAGFLGAPTFDDASDEARPYLRALWEHWWRRRAEFDGSEPPWNFAGARPQNHPQRRLGALAALLRRWGEFLPLTEPRGFGEKRLREFFGKLEHPYWSAHYTLSSKAAGKKMALVGPSRAADLLANQLYPLACAERPALWSAYAALPAAEQNEKVRRAAIRLFGNRPDAVAFTKNLHQQQALLQIYDDFCLADESACEECPFPAQLRQWC